MPLADLLNAKIGVEATAYLTNLLKGPADEPLLAALGGHPMGFKTHIENDLDKWKENGMEPLFVFEGQSIVGKKEMTMRSLKSAISETEQAWALYNDGNPTDAVAAFRKAGECLDATRVLFCSFILTQNRRHPSHRLISHLTRGSYCERFGVHHCSIQCLCSTCCP